MLFALLVGAVCLSAVEPEPVNHCDSLLIRQARDVLALVRAAETTHRGAESAAFTAEYAGTVEREDHLMRPGMTRSVPFRLTVSGDWAAESLLLRETMGQGAAARVETTLIVRGRVASQGATEAAFKEAAGEAARDARAWAVRWLPATSASAAAGAGASCRPSESIEVRGEGERLTPVTFVDAAGRACTLLLDGGQRVVRIESLAADQRLGDVCDWTRFDAWKDFGGVAVPGRVVRHQTLSSTTARYDLSLVSFSSGPLPGGTFDLPPARRGSIVDWGAARSAVAGMEFVEIANGLWSLEIEASDSRVLVVEQADGLTVLEAPDGDAVCRRVVAALREKFPSKPVKTVVPGHHHPASSGGLRAFAAAGARVVASSAQDPYIRWLLSRPTSFGLPAAAAAEQTAVEFFEGERTIEAGDATVRMIDIGEHSAHAFSYVVFYFPKVGVLFEGDLGYFPIDSAVRGGPRLKGLVAEMKRLGIEPTRLVQAWPVRGVRREVEWASVVAAVASASRQPSAK